MPETALRAVGSGTIGTITCIIILQFQAYYLTIIFSFTVFVAPTQSFQLYYSLFQEIVHAKNIIAAEGSLLFLTMCYSAFELPPTVLYT
jgi:hypothetical protein